MHVDLGAFSRQLADLIGRFANHGAKLGEVARELQDGGAPPADELVEALTATRLEFVELRAEIVLAAETLGVAVPDVVESATSLEPVLTAMATALEAHQRHSALEEERDRLVAVLNRMDSVGHQDDDNFGPLVTVKLKAAELKTVVMSATDAEEARSLAGRVQPFADLLTMLESTEVLDDQKFSSLEDSVARAFGRQITVSVARRRLLLPGQTRAPQPRRAAPRRATPPAEPVATEPAPLAPEPEPLTAEPEALAPQPESLAPEPELLTPEPEPLAPEPEPLALEPEVAAAEPVRLADAIRAPEPVRIAAAEPVVEASRPEPARIPPPTYEPPPAPVRERAPVVAAATPPNAQP